MFHRSFALGIARLGAALAVALLASAAPALARQGIFTDLPIQALPARSAGLELPLPRHYRSLAVDLNALENLLARAPLERAAAAEPLLLALPYPDGRDRLFRVEESPILEPGLAAKFPEIRTFTVQGIDDPAASGRLSLTAFGFHAMVLSPSGTVFIDPYKRWDSRYALSYWKADARKAAGASFHCDVKDDKAPDDPWSDSLPPLSLPAAASGTNLRTYRLAVAADGEYSIAVCAPNPAAVSCALSAVVVSVNRVDGVYERDLAIRLVLIANESSIIYTNPATDPYTDPNSTNPPGDPSVMLGQNTSNLNSVIGSANYDIGHVFSTGGGGVASTGVCGSNKARGVTGRDFPIGDAYDIDYVAHEMGHQFGASHTFNGTTGSCGGVNRVSSSAYEPGSGSTIMAYAGICGAEDLQPHSDDPFHTRSFDQIVAYTTTSTGNNCPVTTSTGNTPPVVNAGASFTIPKQTPFTLTGSATDADGDALTYMWEEFDLGTAAPPNDDVAATRPIFRSFVPLTVPSRTFPRLADILNNVSTIGESLPTRGRTMTFRLTARDNRVGGGGVNYASTTVTVNAAAGPFAVTAPDTAVSWVGNTSQNVTWNVANTTAAPVSCANVKIDLSTDGGNTFPATLAASTANDGAEAVSIPNTPTTTARVRVSCVGNIFFDIGNANFTITAGSGLPAPTVSSVAPPNGPVDGGTAVTITGTGFASSGVTVLFGANAATGVAVVNSTTLTAITPAAASAGAVTVTVTNPDTQTGNLASGFTYQLTPARFYTLAPCRIVDTRNANGPDGGPALVGGAVRSFPIAGQCGVPADAQSVAVNVTVVLSSAAGDLRIYPSGLPTPLTSTINFNAGTIRANNAVVGLTGPTAGAIDVMSDIAGGAHFLVDVTGYFKPTAGGSLTECSDGIDNDGDGLIDFGAGPTNDPQCSSAADISEAL